MKKFYLFLFFFFSYSFFDPVQAQIVNFSLAGSNGDESTWPSTSEATGVQPTSLSRGPGVIATANADRFNSKNWTTAASPDMNDYVEFTISPKPGYSITLSTIFLQHQRSVTGPKSFIVRTSFDGFSPANATNEVNVPDVNTNQSSSFTFPSAITSTSPIVVRIYAYNAEVANGTWGPGESVDGNDISISGSFMILPVRFVNVKASWRDKKIAVEWSNATESDVLYYIVERSSSGQNFSELTRLNPLKNDGRLANYTVMDQWPLGNVNYYRIKAVESNGHILYSKIVKIETGTAKAGLSLYPNPAVSGSQIMLQLNGLVAGNYTISVYNAVAQVVHKETITINASSITQSLALQNWQRGMYVVEIRGAVTMQQQLIVR